MRLAELVMARRKDLGLTQAQLADRAEMTRSAINEIENGRTAAPRAVNIPGLARALELPVETVLAATAGGGVPVVNRPGRAGPTADYTAEELREIERFAEYVRSRRGRR